MRLEHVNLTVADLDRSIDFYSRLLGWQVRWKGLDAEGKPSAHVGDERFYVAFFEADADHGEGSRVVADYDRVGFNHLAFVVDDLDAVVARAADLGVEPHIDFSYDPGRHVYVLDPDSIEIELVAYADGEVEAPALR